MACIKKSYVDPAALGRVFGCQRRGRWACARFSHASSGISQNRRRGARIHVHVWPHTLVVSSKPGFRKLKLNFRKNIERCGQRLGVFSDACRHLKQNAMDLRVLFLHEAHEFIILLNSFQGLDENRLSTGTGSMNDSVHAPFLIGLYRDHKALAADRNQLVLNGPIFGKATQIVTQRGLDLAFLLLHFAAQSRKLRRSVVVERAVRQDFAAEESKQQGKICKALGECANGWPALLKSCRRL